MTWNPIDHPHGKHGFFVHKGQGNVFHSAALDGHVAAGHGSYTHLMNLSPGAHIATEGGHMGKTYNIQGFDVHDGHGAHRGTIDVAMAKGDEVYPVHPTHPDNAPLLIQVHHDAFGKVMGASVLSASNSNETPDHAGLHPTLLQAVAAVEKGGDYKVHAPFFGITHPGEPVTSLKQLDSAPVGTVVTTGVFDYMKKADGKWVALHGAHTGSGVGFDVSDFNYALTHGNLMWGSGTGAEPPAGDAVAKKVAAAVEKASAPTTPGQVTEVPVHDGSKGKVVQGDSEDSPHVIVNDKLLHAANTQEIPLPPGSTLYQHKKVKDSFVLKHANGTATKINKGGAVQKAPDSLVAVLGTNYTQVHHVSAKVKVPGTSLEIESYQSVYISKGNTKLWAIVEDGKVVDLIDKATGETINPKPAQIKSWQKSLGATLVCIHNGDSGVAAPVSTSAVEVTPKVAKKVAAGVKKAATAKAPKTPKDPLAFTEGLPKEYKFVSNKGETISITLKPNEVLFFDPGEGNHVDTAGVASHGLYFTLDLGSNKMKRGWLANGATVSEYSSWLKFKKSPAAWLKKDGVKALAAFPVEVDAAALPAPSKTYEPETLHQWLTTPYFKWYRALQAVMIHQGEVPSTVPNEERAKRLVAQLPQIAQQHADFIDSIEKANFTGPAKARFTKALKSVAAIHDLVYLLSRIQDGHEITPADEAKAAAALTNIEANQGWKYTNVRGVFNTAWNDAKFAQSVKGIGFNPMSGTHEDYVAFAQANDCQYLAGFSDEMLKTWTLGKLGAPSVSPGQVSVLENKAKQNMMVAALVLKADAVAAAKDFLSDEPLSDLAAKKVALAYAKLANAYASYTSEGGQHLLHWNGAAGWSESFDYGKSWSFVPPDKAGALIAVMAPLEESGKIGSPAQKIAKELESEALDWNTPQGLIDLGAQGVSNMDDWTRHAWLVAYLTQNPVMQYEIEANEVQAASGGASKHPFLWTHDGSPETDQGKLNRQLMANWLAQQPWFMGANPEAYSDDDRTQAKAVLGFTEAADILGSSDDEVFHTWLNMVVQALPPAQSAGVNTGSAKMNVLGHDIEVSPGDQVIYKDFGGGLDSAILIINDEKGAPAHGLLIESKGGGPPKTNPIPTIMDHPDYYATMLGQGWADISPTFTQASVKDAKPKLGLADKPQDVLNEYWALTLGAEGGGEELAGLIGEYANESSVPLENVQATIFSAGKLKVLTAPEPIQRLYAWAKSTSNLPLTDRQQIIKSIEARANAGEYLTPDTTLFTPLDGGTSIALPPGASLHDVGNGYLALILEGGKKGYLYHKNGEPYGSISNWDIDGYAKKPKIAESLANLTPDKAKADGFTFSDGAWAALSDAEAQSHWAGEGQEGSAAYLFNQGLVGVGLADQYAAFTHKVNFLPPGVKQFAVEAAQHGDTDKLDALVWKHGKGFYDQGIYAYAHLLASPDAIYAKHLGLSQTSTEAIQNYWPYAAMQAFLTDHQEGIAKQVGTSDIHGLSAFSSATLIANYIKHLADEQAEIKAPPKLNDAEADTSHVTLTWVKKKSEGMHSGDIWHDQTGTNLWMSKAFPSDPNAEQRVDAEHYANVIGRLLGFKQPATAVRTLTPPDSSPQYSYVQHLADADGSLMGYGIGDLNETQLAAAMAEHVLDWLISNHDSHPENLLRAPDGKSIIGIDKGQAWKLIGNDKLAANWKPDGNPNPVWYDVFYNAVLNHQIDQDLADRIAEKVLLRAYQTQSRFNDRYEELVRAALAKRKDWSLTSTSDFESTVALCLARKASLLKDFNDFYSDLWKQAGWDWKIDTADFGKKVGAAHIANGPQFVGEVQEAGSIGKALMFASPDIVDKNLVFSPMTQKDGGTTLLGSGYITPEADKALTAWLEQNVTGQIPMAAMSSPDEGKSPQAVLPGLSNFTSALQSFVKTVNHHFGDKEYNQDTVNAAKKQAKVLQDTYNKAVDYRSEYPEDPTVAEVFGVHFSTGEQRDAWIAAAAKKLGEYEIVLKAFDAQNKVEGLWIDAPNYQPTEGLKAYEDKPEPVEAFKTAHGMVVTKQADGSHWSVTPDGNKAWLSADDFASVAKDGEPVDLTSHEPNGKWTNSLGEAYVEQPDGTWWEVGPDGTAFTKGMSKDDVEMAVDLSPEEWTLSHGDDSSAEEKTVEVQVAGKELTVTQGSAATHSGKIDFDTGKLKQVSTSDSTDFQSGTDFMVSHGNVKIRYRPFNGGAQGAQKGLLQIQVSDWDGTPSSIDDVFDTMQMMGIDMTPADAETLELVYWQKAHSVLRTRDLTSAEQKVLDTITAGLHGKTNLSQADEIKIHKDAWRDYLGDKVDEIDTSPQFGTWFGSLEGRPSWQRPDFGLDHLKEIWDGKLAQHDVFVDGSGTNQHDVIPRTVQILQSGGLLSTEERLRVLGALYHGMSSTSDQGKGTSNVVYTRNNLVPFEYTNGVCLFIDPRASLSLDTYGLSTDAFGVGKATSPFGESFLTHNASNNETCIPFSAPIVGVVCRDDSWRQDLLQQCAAVGLTEVQGIPIEEFIVGPNDWKALSKKVWERVEAEEKETV